MTSTPPAPDAVIAAERLTKTYGSDSRRDGGGERTVVDIDRLAVHRGEILGLLGPNGAGKTTFVEMCEGYRTPTSGSLRVLGQGPSTAPAAWRARIGIVTQETGAFNRLRVREALGHLASFYPDPRPVGETLELADLAGLGDRFTDELSGGQRRRLDVACGVIGRPELLFLDEPTTGLDPEVRRRLWGVINGLKNEGATIVLTTHYLDEAEVLADRVAVLVAGRLIALDTPDRLGGRAMGEAVVAFTPGEGAEPVLAAHAWERLDDGRVAIRTPTPTSLIAALHAPGGEIDGLTVTRPTLEDTYLRLIGEQPNTCSDTPRDRATTQPHATQPHTAQPQTAQHDTTHLHHTIGTSS